MYIIWGSNPNIADWYSTKYIKLNLLHRTADQVQETYCAKANQQLLLQILGKAGLYVTIQEVRCSRPRIRTSDLQLKERNL